MIEGLKGTVSWKACLIFECYSKAVIISYKSPIFYCDSAQELAHLKLEKGVASCFLA